MNESETVSAFALCRKPGAPNAVCRIPLTDPAQKRIADIISEQTDNFTGPSLERVPFDPTYMTDELTVLWINGFSLPEHIQEAIDNPREIPVFSEPANRIKALFYGSSPNRVGRKSPAMALKPLDS